jgi:threonine dehydrogenase-like Zn-dependent dehydrogenase
MPETVLAATLHGPYDLRVDRYPYPSYLEPGAVLLRMLASGICGTDKHTFRGETEQYAGTDHAKTTPFPIIQGHENVGEIVEIGDGGAKALDGTPLAVGDRIVPAPNLHCGECGYCTGDFPYFMCRRIETYGNSLTSAESPHLFGGHAEYHYILPGTHMFKVPDDLPTNIAVLTEVYAVTHSLDKVAAMPRPGGFREGDTVAIYGLGPVGAVHAGKARIMGASRVIAIDQHEGRLALAKDLGATDTVLAADDPAEVKEAVLDLVGDGVDVSVDASGHPATFLPAMDVLRDGGTLIEVGAFVDLGPVDVNPSVILARNLTIVGVGGEDARGYDATMRMLADNQDEIAFHKAVTHTFPVEKAQEAMETAQAAGDAMKVVISPEA